MPSAAALSRRRCPGPQNKSANAGHIRLSRALWFRAGVDSILLFSCMLRASMTIRFG
jgi:hypothetical protein